jgi:exodeoxyribonuclease V alpha subunit
MILTKNQSYFDLYNGDSGVVVNCDTRPTLMLKRKGKFVFYPISLLLTDSIETAFAITIHKAQGSGYPNIMMFLPTRKGHPLLNRQILYTGVTRTKKQSLTVVATPEAFNFACGEVIRRDTGFDFKP